jgi:hypothetical protein
VTLLELKDRLLKRLAESSSAPVAVSSAEAIAAINEAQRLFVLLTLCLERTGTFNLSAGECWYQATDQITDWLLPLRCVQRPVAASGAIWDETNFDETVWDQAPVDRGVAVRVKPARLEDMDALSPTWQTDTDDTAERYGVFGFETFFVWPAPENEGTDLDITYAAEPRTISQDTDEPDIPAQYHLALIDGAMPICRLKDGGVELERTKPYFAAFLDQAAKCAEIVRARSRTFGYDREPFELQAFDRSRLIEMPKKPRKEAA